MSSITYKKRRHYKYTLVEDYPQSTDFRGFGDIVTPYIELTNDGYLTVKKGYAWDGPSGPTIDTKTFMRGALVHDALYQLIREEHLPPASRADADTLLRTMCLDDGMNKLRAWYVYKAVVHFGKSSADPKYLRLTAP